MNKPAFAALAEYMDLLLDAICVVDPEHRFSYLSPGAQRVFGYEPEEMIGRSMFDFMHPDHHAETLLRAEQVNSGRDVLHFENRYIHKDGSVIHLHWTARWSEKDQMRIGVARDITAQRALEQEREALIERLEHMALTDSLTQLPNRALFYDRVRTAQARAERDAGGLAILYLDLDKFKEVNDHYGHATGDELLKAVATRIQSAIRNTDTAARLGGDEFVVLVDASHTRRLDSAIDKVVNKIQAALKPPHIMKHGSLAITASIGVAMWPEHGHSIEQLLHHADQAMYNAKRRGGNSASTIC